MGIFGDEIHFFIIMDDKHAQLSSVFQEVYFKTLCIEKFREGRDFQVLFSKP